MDTLRRRCAWVVLVDLVLKVHTGLVTERAVEPILIGRLVTGLMRGFNLVVGAGHHWDGLQPLTVMALLCVLCLCAGLKVSIKLGQSPIGLSLGIYGDYNEKCVGNY
jgi:hypothetical protein